MRVIRHDDGHPHVANTFTGTAGLYRLLDAQQPGGIALTVVRFEDGARTFWHTHPGEQVLYILEGRGRVGTAEEEFLLEPGDVVHTPPGEKHWHGAAPGSHMTHISITTVGPPDWLEPVS
jgi:quercetin dioxygenase-like cupin family protein